MRRGGKTGEMASKHGRRNISKKTEEIMAAISYSTSTQSWRQLENGVWQYGAWRKWRRKLKIGGEKLGAKIRLWRWRREKAAARNKLSLRLKRQQPEEASVRRSSKMAENWRRNGISIKACGGGGASAAASQRRRQWLMKQAKRRRNIEESGAQKKMAWRGKAAAA
jgi:hypothetical protein